MAEYFVEMELQGVGSRRTHNMRDYAWTSTHTKNDPSYYAWSKKIQRIMCSFMLLHGVYYCSQEWSLRFGWHTIGNASLQ